MGLTARLMKPKNQRLFDNLIKVLNQKLIVIIYTHIFLYLFSTFLLFLYDSRLVIGSCRNLEKDPRLLEQIISRNYDLVPEFGDLKPTLAIKQTPNILYG
jgi:hypothetical protein